MYRIIQPKIFKFTDNDGSPDFFMITEISPAAMDDLITEYRHSNPVNATAKDFEKFLNDKGYYAEITWSAEKERRG